jgi:hypothetical protein
MSLNENDLRDALRELERRADQQGAPSTASILSHAQNRRDWPRKSAAQRWRAPLAAAAVVAAAVVTTTVVATGHRGPAQRPDTQAAGRPTAARSTAPRAATTSPSLHPTAATRAQPAVAILDDAAARLDAAPAWTAPDPRDFFYVHTTEATTWTSVSGTRAGQGRAADGGMIWVSGCRNSQIVSNGESGSCTLSDVPHYLGDAPTTPKAWDAYLEELAPGAKANDAQGKIIVEVLHQDLTSPKAAAALLRYTAGCPGLHTLTVQPVGAEALIGVTCTSMTNGSYGLVFDAASRAFVGFVVVTPDGRQNGPAEIVRKTGIVPAIGQTP